MADGEETKKRIPKKAGVSARISTDLKLELIKKADEAGISLSEYTGNVIELGARSNATGNNVDIDTLLVAMQDRFPILDSDSNSLLTSEESEELEQLKIENQDIQAAFEELQEAQNLPEGSILLDIPEEYREATEEKIKKLQKVYAKKGEEISYDEALTRVLLYGLYHCGISLNDVQNESWKKMAKKTK